MVEQRKTEEQPVEVQAVEEQPVEQDKDKEQNSEEKARKEKRPEKEVPQEVPAAAESDSQPREISQAVISRLPRYYRYLGDLKDAGVERVSSQELSHLMHVTASQIRQDFNHFGGFGQQGYGYNTEHLYTEIGRILGLDQQHSMVLIGAGNLGTALVRYMNFRRRGFVFKAAFDIDSAKTGRKIADIMIYPMEQLPSYIRANNIDIVVLTIPKKEAVKAAGILAKCPIKAIWNFAHCDLHVPDRIQVENVHLSDSLMKLSYNIRRYEEGKRTEHIGSDNGE